MKRIVFLLSAACVSSTTTAAKVAAYLYPAYHVERTNQENRVSGKGKRWSGHCQATASGNSSHRVV